MGFLDRFNRSTLIKESMDMITEQRRQIEALNETLTMRESATGLDSLRLEDYMWEPITGWSRDDGLSIERLKVEADHCRQLYAINPLIKKAITARVGMIHGRGARITLADGSVSDKLTRELKANDRKMFGSVARARLETELSNAGNVWAMKQRGKPAVIVPLSQISGYVSDADDPATVLYWRRTYSAVVTDADTGMNVTKSVDEYIPTPANTRPELQIGTVPVRVGATMIHIAANRQEGWVLGLPDVFAAKFWTKGHKEMFEAGHEYALAQGEFAATVTGGTGMSASLAASRLADAPRRDPETGAPYGYGGTAVMSDGLSYQLMGKMGSGVDFTSYDRIAGLIAAAVGVPLEVILATSDSEEVSLEQSVVEDMKLRQKLWSEFYEDYLSELTVDVLWPRIKQDTLYRMQQSIEIANRTNTLRAEEKRLLALESFNLGGKADDLPSIEDHPDVMVYRAKKEIDLEYADKIAAASASATSDAAPAGRSTTPDQGNDQGIGKLSDGKDAHDARDRGEQEHTK